jgi:dyslexia susceptibility 1 candidate gene 1 protein
MVLAGTYEWRQSRDDVTLVVPLKGCSPGIVDLYVARTFVKINFKPYLVQVDLWAAVDDVAAVSAVEGGALTVRLPKLVREQWPTLLCAQSDDKTAMRDRRLAAMEDKQARAAAAAKALSERRVEDERAATRAQMRVDEEERQRLEDLKAEEKQHAEQSVYAALQQLGRHEQEQALAAMAPESSPTRGILRSHANSHALSNSGTRRVSFSDDLPEEIGLAAGQGELEPLEAAGGGECASDAIFTDDDVLVENIPGAAQIKSELTAASTTPPKHQPPKATTPPPPPQPLEQPPLLQKQSKGAGGPGAGAAVAAGARGDDLEAVLPQPRASARIVVGFTPRVFPTPMRESKQEEEQDWLLRNRRHLKTKQQQAVLEGMDISERDPQWLVGKGNDFFQAGNVEGALNAYSTALDVDSGLVSALSNRAACWLKLCLPARAVEDCSAALLRIAKDAKEEAELASREGFAEPPRELHRTRESRKKLHARKGQALKDLDDLAGALREFQLALELDEFNEDLKADTAQLTLLVQAAAFKDMGDAEFRAKDPRAALLSYGKALALNPDLVPALLNRSACHLKLGDTAAMVEDCRAALEVLDAQGAGAAQCAAAVAAAAAAAAATQGGSPAPLPPLPGLVATTSAAPTAQPPPRLSPPEQHKQRKAVEEATLRIKLLVRLGTGEGELGELASAFAHFKAALELAPTDIDIAKQAKRAESLLAAASAGTPGDT